MTAAELFGFVDRADTVLVCSETCAHVDCDMVRGLRDLAWRWCDVQRAVEATGRDVVWLAACLDQLCEILADTAVGDMAEPVLRETAEVMRALAGSDDE